MSITKTDKNTLLVVPEGELDHHLAAGLRREIDTTLDAETRNLIFDFSALTFMDSSGIGMIMGRYKKVQAIGGKLIIAAPRPQVRRIIEMSGLLSIIRIEPDVKHALKRM